MYLPYTLYNCYLKLLHRVGTKHKGWLRVLYNPYRLLHLRLEFHTCICLVRTFVCHCCCYHRIVCQLGGFHRGMRTRHHRLNKQHRFVCRLYHFHRKCCLCNIQWNKRTPHWWRRHHLNTVRTFGYPIHCASNKHYRLCNDLLNKYKMHLPQADEHVLNQCNDLNMVHTKYLHG